jgi:hypothetical protein
MHKMDEFHLDSRLVCNMAFVDLRIRRKSLNWELAFRRQKCLHYFLSEVPEESVFDRDYKQRERRLDH